MGSGQEAAELRLMDYEHEYSKLLKSGMFWEFYPELSGNWHKDQAAFIFDLLTHRKGIPAIEKEPKPPTQLQVAIRKLIEAANEVKKLTDENS